MKKLIVVLFILAVTSPAFAQQKDDNKESFYYINVSVEKIFPSSEGFVVMYHTGNSIHIIGIPNDWLYDSAGAAQIVKLQMPSDWPTMSVFYNEGKFSHVRLYTHPAKSHFTWGNIPQGTDVSRYFMDKESFKLQF